MKTVSPLIPCKNVINMWFPDISIQLPPTTALSYLPRVVSSTLGLPRLTFLQTGCERPIRREVNVKNPHSGLSDQLLPVL